jgi:sec-independent protein translocase protein TatC
MSGRAVARPATRARRRRGAWLVVLLLALAALLTPPDPISQIGLALPMYALYELSILSVKWVERQRAAKLAAEAASNGGTTAA